jgi:ATP-dependent Lon protease
MPAEARKKAEAELKKLKLMSPMSAEATVVRNYIEVLTGLPWSKKTKIKHDLANAEEVLNEDHFGLEKVKDRILEYLAVQQRVDKVKAPIPVPGGSSRRGQDLAGAVHCQGHGPQVRAHGAGRHARRGRNPRPPPHLHRLHAGQGAAEPEKVGTRNPLFLLDEIDKLGMDFRGDPSSALLEVLDPSRTTPSATTTSRSTSTCPT